MLSSFPLLMSNLAYFRPSQEFGKPDLSTVQSPHKLYSTSLFISKIQLQSHDFGPKQAMADKIWLFDVV